ncbi:hypothetical protein CJ030_MR0G027286 [Morella rubra]|uniref:Uncharacterized protein n=1 Tax=Morella rubra TaxID=262757 RepID=A0A6A1UG12_9ROSI|nr:hypothetical protein CJ030_MR0G027286 [Morella rubra]
MEALGPSVSSSLSRTAPTSKPLSLCNQSRKTPSHPYFTETLHPYGWKSKIDDQDCSDSGFFGGDKSSGSRGHLPNSCVRCWLSYSGCGRCHREDVRCVEDQAGWFRETRTIFYAPDVVGFSLGSRGNDSSLVKFGPFLSFLQYTFSPIL